MHGSTADVIVIGAGVAGLAAAAQLAKAGLKVVIIEGRNTVGGRIRTIHLPSVPVPVEAGAEFIHGFPEEIWDAVRQLGLPVTELDGRNLCKTANGLQQCDDFWEKWERISDRMPQRGNDQSFLSFINTLVRRNRRMAKARGPALEYVQGFNAADARKISVHSLIQDGSAADRIQGDRAFRWIHGYDRFVHILENELSDNVELILSTVVNEIRWREGDVRVRTQHAVSGKVREFRAPASIVTLPLGVLQSSRRRTSVRFVPAIRKKKEAADSLVMGPVVKLHIWFREAFWRDTSADPVSFLHLHDEPVPVWWTTAPVWTPLLTGWAAGPPADALRHLSAKQTLQRGLKSLSSAFGRSAAKLKSDIRWWAASNWQSNPFTLGAYSYAPAGKLDARKSLAEAVAGTLFFAGEATNISGASGTVHGAIATGRRAASEIIEHRRVLVLGTHT